MTKTEDLIKTVNFRHQPLSKECRTKAFEHLIGTCCGRNYAKTFDN